MGFIGNANILDTCIRLLLKPVVKYCVRNSIGFQQTQSALKSVYTQEARDFLESKGSKVNAARISAMTGIHRGEVKSLLKQDKGNPRPPDLDIAGKVIARWLDDDTFRNPDGSPKVLSYKGNNSQFYSLVRSVSLDVVPRSLLDRFLHTGITQKTDDGLELLTGGHIPEGDHLEGFAMLSEDLEDLIRCVDWNLQHSETKNLHLTTVYDHVDAEAESTIRAWLLEEGTRFHYRARRFLSQYDLTAGRTLPSPGDGKSQKVTISTFSLVHKDEQDE